jgi:hypothetical protein
MRCPQDTAMLECRQSGDTRKDEFFSEGGIDSGDPLWSKKITEPQSFIGSTDAPELPMTHQMISIPGPDRKGDIASWATRRHRKLQSRYSWQRQSREHG